MTAHPKPRRAVVLLVLLLLTLLTCYIQLVEWPMPLTHGIDHRDSGVFIHGGWVLIQGGVPYVDFWDQKPPLVFMLNAAALLIGGTPTAVWWLSLLASLLALLFAWRALRRMTSTQYALAGTAAAVVSLVGTLQGGNVVELYALPIRWWLLSSALTLLELRSGALRKRMPRFAGISLAMGIGAGLLLMLRQNEVLGAHALFIGVIWTLIDERRWRELLATTLWQWLGFHLVLGVGIYWLTSNGAFKLFLDQVFTYNVVHKVTATTLMRLDAWGAIFDYLPVYGLAVIGWILFSYRFIRDREWGGSPLVRIVWVWLPIETVTALTSGQRFPHYFLSLIPAATAMFAVALQQMDRSITMRKHRRLLWGVVALLLVINLVKFQHQLFRPFHSARGEMVAETGEWIRQHTDADDKVTIWGMVPELYIAAERQPGTRMTHVYPLLSPPYTDDGLIDEWIDDLWENRPVVLIDASSHNGRIPPLSSWQDALAADPRPLHPSLERFYNVLHTAYVPVDTVGAWKWVVYERIDRAGVSR